MEFTLNESDKTISFSKDQTLKAVMDMADRWKLDINKYKIAGKGCACRESQPIN